MKDKETLRLIKDKNHWKACHDNMVLQNAFLRQRPDLPVDRIPAYKEMQAKIDLLKQALKALTYDCIASDFNEHWDSFINAEKILAQTEN